MSAPEIIYPPAVGGGTPVGGSGTTNTIPRWTGPTTLGDSQLKDNGTLVGIGASLTSGNRLVIGGVASGTSFIKANEATFQIGNIFAGPVQILTGDTPQVTVTGTGNVGIGTASPVTTLHVARNGTTDPAIIGSGTNSAVGNFESSDFGRANRWTFGRDNSLTGNFVLAYNGSTLTSTTSTGNVGIGTASPAGRLDVVGVAGLSWAIRAQVSSANTSPALNAELGLNLKNTSATVGNYTSITNRDSSDNANTQINFINVNNSGSGAINFVTRDSVGGSGERARITSTGNVGIGTTNPNARLEIASTSSGSAQFRLSNASGLTNWWEIGRDNAVTGALIFTSNFGERVRFSSATAQVAIGTSSFTTGRALTTVADLDVFGVRVGRGVGDQATNTAVGASALNANTSGSTNTALGASALAANTTANANTAVGSEAGNALTSNGENTFIGQQAGYFPTNGENTAVGRVAMRGIAGSSTGSSNTAIGRAAMYAFTTGNANTALGRNAGFALSTGNSNVLIGERAADTLTTGSANIVIGRLAATAAATDSNQLVLGSATEFVATNGGATTYYATAGASLGYIQVRLNGANVKIQVFAP